MQFKKSFRMSEDSTTHCRMLQNNPNVWHQTLLKEVKKEDAHLNNLEISGVPKTKGKRNYT